MKKVMDKYGDQVYRPGEEIGNLDDLTDDDMVNRRGEIEAFFTDSDLAGEADENDEDKVGA